MNVLIISRCTERALVETHRILDQFAERLGDRAWQTPITQAGLHTLRRLLQKTARKNTAVACHRIRGRDHSELLWIVGDAGQFNEQGAAPTNITRRDVLRTSDENDWHTGQDIQLLTALAGLLHDLGKACAAFQARLRGKLQEVNQYRHEWISLRLFAAFVGDDDDAGWLARLAAPTPQDDARWTGPCLQRDGLDAATSTPFSCLRRAPLAQAIGWLVVTHHRLPTLPRSADLADSLSPAMLKNVLQRVEASWNADNGTRDMRTLEGYWRFDHGLPVTTALWRARAARLAQRLLPLAALRGKEDWLNNPYAMHIARMSLMLADHHYSSLPADDPARFKVPAGYPLHANTVEPGGALKQTLDEHLLGVARQCTAVTRALPHIAAKLPRLARHKGLRKRAQLDKFRWQDRAADLAVAMRERSVSQGAFIVNMASTGCGKTLANARVMYGLSDPELGMRCAFAMGLRTLTLQTGAAFRDALGLRDEDLAVKVGGTASRELFKHYEAQAEKSGSASRQDLLDETGHVHFDGNADADPVLGRLLRERQVRELLLAPVLVSTIDHLTPATETERGGRQIAPMLRLMSGDLVLDEPDDFDLGDLPALVRLVNWAGMLGARVLLSSATLPPALVQGLFEAYREGRRHYLRNRVNHLDASAADPLVCCAWIDEFRQVQSDCSDTASFCQSHDIFVVQRHAQLAGSVVQRRAAIIPLPLMKLQSNQRVEAFARHTLDAAQGLHRQNHSIDPRSGKRVSFGLIRMANIGPLVDTALALYRLGAPDGMRVHLCTYHSQYPLLLRSAIERQLDQALNRRWPADVPSEPVFSLPDVRQRIDQHDEADQLFIVLGSPVTEVGRDHDYDWAVVEPSSMRSLIQLAGRVRRHRPGPCGSPNLLLFDTNLRNFRDDVAFCKPGFESVAWRLGNHSLESLLRSEEWSVIDARPRIVHRPADQLDYRNSLVDLEHVRIRQVMLEASTPRPQRLGTRLRGSERAGASTVLNAASWWRLPAADAGTTAILQREQPFRKSSGEDIDLYLAPNADGDDYVLTTCMQASRRDSAEHTVERQLNHRIDGAMVRGERIAPWGCTDYMQALAELAAALDMPLLDCARKFGVVSLRKSIGGWRFHPALGFGPAPS